MAEQPESTRHPEARPGAPTKPVEREGFAGSMFAPPSGDMVRDQTLIEQVKYDLIRQWQEGKPVALETYLEVFSELGTPETVSVELILAEYIARCQSGASVDLSSFEERFPHQVEALTQLLDQDAECSAHPLSVLDQLVTRTGETTSPTLALFQGPRVPVRLPRQFGRYRILKQIGRGAMGTVYLVDDQQLGRRVALKVPHFRSSDDNGTPDQHDLDRFYREARIAARLNHPNLCPVYDVGQIEGIHYLAMAYLKGRPLSHCIQHDRPMPPRRAAALVRKMALAMEAAHRHGIVHRDLKPSNVMVTSRQRLVIMDFGLAWRIGAQNDRSTRVGLVVGTPAYMSPEQVSNKVDLIGPRCDIYSLGVTLYELLTGQLPFVGPEAVVLAQILFYEPEPPSTKRPGLDPQIEAICLKAMAKRMEDRYASMAEFAKALSDYLRSPKGQPPPQHLEMSRTEPAPRDPPRPSQSDRALPVRDQRPAFEGFLSGPNLPGAGTVVVEPERQECRTKERSPSYFQPFEEVQEESEGPSPTAEAAELTTLLAAWSRWTAVVEHFALRRSRRPIDREDYAKLYKQLVEICRSHASAAHGPRQTFFYCLEDLVRPWLNPKAFMQADREILVSLLSYCREAEQRLQNLVRFSTKKRGGWIGTPTNWLWVAIGSLLAAIMFGAVLWLWLSA